MVKAWTKKEYAALMKLIPTCETYAEVAGKHNGKWDTGRSPDSIRSKLVREGVPNPNLLLGTGIKKRRAADTPVSKQIEKLVSTLARRPMSLSDLADALDLSPSRTKGLLRVAKDMGRAVDVERGEISLLSEAPAVDRWAVHRLPIEPVCDEIRFLAISDTHYGSRQQRPECVADAVDIAYNDWGIRHVLHSGDVCDGLSVYRGHETEILDHSFDAQVDRAAKSLPKRKGLSYHLIGGNHDENFLKHSRADGIRKLGDMRDDITTHGYYSALVDLALPGRSGVRVELHHPGGGLSYARSYGLQKRIEAIPGGMKPQIFLSGHLHCFLHMHYRGVAAFLVPCFQDKTLLFERLRATPEIGAIMFRVGVTKSGSIKTMQTQYLSYMHSRRGPLVCKTPDGDIRMGRNFGCPSSV